jgi:ATP-dependent Lhr-like helicase
MLTELEAAAGGKAVPDVGERLAFGQETEKAPKCGGGGRLRRRRRP